MTDYIPTAPIDFDALLASPPFALSPSSIGSQGFVLQDGYGARLYVERDDVHGCVFREFDDSQVQCMILLVERMCDVALVAQEVE